LVCSLDVNNNKMAKVYTRDDMGNGQSQKQRFEYFGPKFNAHNFTTNGTRNVRGQLIMFNPETGQRIFNRPTKKIDDCFEIENISWMFSGVDKSTGKLTDFKTASAGRERQFRSENAAFYVFS
jgi:hypothetical protein